MSTIAKFVGWVHGRSHNNTPVEITGVPLPYDVLSNVRVTIYVPVLTPHELYFTFEELDRNDFEIGSQVEVTVAGVKKLATVEIPTPSIGMVVPDSVVTAPQPAVPAASMEGEVPTDVSNFLEGMSEGTGEVTEESAGSNG